MSRLKRSGFFFVQNESFEIAFMRLLLGIRSVFENQ